MPEDFFGEPVAVRYDAAAAEMFDPAVVGPAVDLLARLACDGRALELGIGTGRIALPLAGRGVPVAGIDLSEAMIARLREKPGQGLVSHHFETIDGALRRHSIPFRYTWPAELDLMARLAGMRLRDRWADWDRTPFTSASRKHVSVWEKA